jgi:purine nucleosidase
VSNNEFGVRSSEFADRDSSFFEPRTSNSELTAKRLVIDTDTASDDAVALVMAFRLPETRVEAVTTVAGNVALPLATRNALITAELCDADVPVYMGSHKPLVRPHVDATSIHGADGLGNTGQPDPRRKPEQQHAVDALIARFLAEPGELTLVTLGPLTNIALAILREPRFAATVKECYVMGGAANVIGNVTPSAEYNIWCDPEAARIVFHSGMPLTMIPFELCLGDAMLDAAEADALDAVGTPYARFCVAINRFLVDSTAPLIETPGMNLPDPITVAIALDHAIMTRSGFFHVDVETISELTRGETVVDRFATLGKPPNVTVGLASDGAAFKRMLHRACR